MTSLKAEVLYPEVILKPREDGCDGRIWGWNVTWMLGFVMRDENFSPYPNTEISNICVQLYKKLISVLHGYLGSRWIQDNFIY